MGEETPSNYNVITKTQDISCITPMAKKWTVKGVWKRSLMKIHHLFHEKLDPNKTLFCHRLMLPRLWEFSCTFSFRLFWVKFTWPLLIFARSSWTFSTRFILRYCTKLPRSSPCICIWRCQTKLTCSFSCACFTPWILLQGYCTKNPALSYYLLSLTDHNFLIE